MTTEPHVFTLQLDAQETPAFKRSFRKALLLRLSCFASGLAGGALGFALARLLLG
jgi:hypothetical protein